MGEFSSPLSPGHRLIMLGESRPPNLFEKPIHCSNSINHNYNKILESDRLSPSMIYNGNRTECKEPK